MRNILFLISLFVFAACSPSKKLEKLQEKHPELFYNVVDSVTVTVYEVDTIKIDTQVFITNDVIVNCDDFLPHGKPVVIVKESDKHTTVFEVRKDRNGQLNIDTKTIVKPQIIEVLDTVFVPVGIEKNCPKLYGSRWYHSLGWIFALIILGVWFITSGKFHFNIFNPK